MFVSTHGITARPTSSPYGTLTTAWIAATGESDLTILGALNTLESDLTTYGLTSKMKALYPMVGGTAAKHKYNFMNAQDTDVAYRLVFNGGWTHSSTGALPNGTNAYADTKLNATLLIQDNTHLSVYSRTNSDGLFCDIGYISATGSDETNLFSKYSNTLYPRIQATNSGVANSVTSAGLMMANRTSSTVVKGIRNTVITSLSNNSSTKSTSTSDIVFIGALNRRSIPDVAFYSSREYAFSSIGDGLNDTEAANFYTAVQTFQTTLGRQVGVPIVSDADAQTFLNAAVITDTTQASAINTLVTGLKADGLWAKMAAIYPMVGGTATAHSYNLKNTAAYQITWNGGLTHSSTGVLPNGTNGWGNLNFPLYETGGTGVTPQDNHISFYSRTNLAGKDDIWLATNGNFYLGLLAKYDVNNNAYYGNNSTLYNVANSDARGFYIGKSVGTTAKLFRNGSSIVTGTASGTSYAGSFMNNTGLFFGGAGYGNKECAFASVGLGLSDTEAANLNTRVQTYQTALSRNV